MLKMFARLRFFLDVPSVLFVALCFFLLRHVIVDVIVPLIGAVCCLNDFLLGVAVNLVSAAILGLPAIVWYRHLARYRLAGEYKASVFKADGENDWGTVRILCHPLAPDRNGVPVKLRLDLEDVVLEGRGLIVDKRYLVGHYTEVGKPERRRSGAFFYELDGTGQTWRGKYLFVDPNSANCEEGTAKWTRI